MASSKKGPSGASRKIPLREKRQPKGDYPVGYARPPKEYQFRPKQSGNPRGRPPGAKNAKTVAENVFFKRKVPLTEGGKTIKVSVLEGMLLRVAEKALNKGDPRALTAALSFLQRTGHLTEKEATAIQESLAPEDEEMLAEYFRRRGLVADDDEDK